MYSPNSSSRKIVSTVVSTKGCPASIGLSSKKECMLLGVLFTFSRRGMVCPSNPWLMISRRCCCTSVICSLQITQISSASCSMKMRIRRSMRRSPWTRTKGLGSLMPSAASREPSPAAIIAYLIINTILLLYSMFSVILPSARNPCNVRKWHLLSNLSTKV